MVWTGIAHGHTAELVFINGALDAQRYRDITFQLIGVRFVQRHGLTFQHDNTRTYIARICNTYLQANYVDVLSWPAFSPDLSPIEHLWDRSDRRVRKRQPAPTTIGELRQALREEWNNISIGAINVLINSMHRRIRAAMAANEGHTKGGSRIFSKGVQLF